MWQGFIRSPALSGVSPGSTMHKPYLLGLVAILLAVSFPTKLLAEHLYDYIEDLPSPAGPPPLYPHHESCADLYVLAATALCEVKLNNTILNVQVYHCKAKTHFNSMSLSRVDTDLEILLIKSGPSIGVPHPESVFRVRVHGPEIFLPQIMYCSGKEAATSFNFRLPGLYSIEVLKLHGAFSFSSPYGIPLSRDIWVGNYSAPGPQALRMDPKGLKPTSVADTHKHMPKCPPGIQLPGRYLVLDPEDPHIQSLKTTCVWWNDPSSVHSVHECTHTLPYWLICGNNSVPIPGKLSFQPQHCRLPEAREHDPEQCLTNRKVCFIGDSQMRHIYNGFVSWSEPSNFIEGRYDGQTNYVILNSNASLPWQMSFTWSTYGLTEAEIPPHCTDIITNFGQWPCADQAQPRPWSAQQYMRTVQHVANILTSMREKRGTRVYWATTNCIGWKESHQMVGDRRTDAWLMLYNKVASELMQHAGIPIIDTWSLCSTLSDTAYDGHHYHPMGAVGWEITRVVVNTLCSMPLDQAARPVVRPVHGKHGDTA